MKRRIGSKKKSDATAGGIVRPFLFPLSDCPASVPPAGKCAAAAAGRFVHSLLRGFCGGTGEAEGGMGADAVGRRGLLRRPAGAGKEQQARGEGGEGRREEGEGAAGLSPSLSISRRRDRRRLCLLLRQPAVVFHDPQDDGRRGKRSGEEGAPSSTIILQLEDKRRRRRTIPPRTTTT